MSRPEWLYGDTDLCALYRTRRDRRRLAFMRAVSRVAPYLTGAMLALALVATAVAIWRPWL